MRSIDISDFHEFANQNESDGHTDDKTRLRLANLAVDAFDSSGGIVSGSHEDLFSYAMDGHPMLGPAIPENIKPTRIFLWRLASRFTQASADTPFIPGNYLGKVEPESTVRWHPREPEIPRHIYIRGQEPYSPMPEGWGLKPDDTSVEYRVARNPIDNLVIGQVILRGCHRIHYGDLVTTSRQSITAVDTTRSDVVLYETVRHATDGLPTLPAGQLPLFYPEFLNQTEQSNPDSASQDDTEQAIPHPALYSALQCAVRAVQHRGDYYGNQGVSL